MADEQPKDQSEQAGPAEDQAKVAPRGATRQKAPQAAAPSAPVTDEQAEEAPEERDTERRDLTLPVDMLLANARGYLGVPAHIAAGGLHGVQDDISIEDAKSRIEDWLNKPVGEPVGAEEAADDK